jgi:hypothetical protein
MCGWAFSIFFLLPQMTVDSSWGARMPPTRWEFVVPLWPIAALSLPLTAVRSIKWRRRQRSKVGCCAKCGYDLRATPQRCPECGTASASVSTIS